MHSNRPFDIPVVKATVLLNAAGCGDQHTLLSTLYSLARDHGQRTYSILGSVVDQDGNNILMKACMMGQPGANPVNLSQADVDLVLTSCSCIPEIARLVLAEEVWPKKSTARSAFLNEQNSFGNKALHIAIFGFHFECIKVLYNHDANMSATNSAHMTGIVAATAAYPHATNDSTRQTCISLVEGLAFRGTDVNTRTNTGETALHIAVA